MSTPSPMFGVAELRDSRGGDRVTFGELADLLVMFAERSPQDSTVIDALASFLAKAADAD
jgi:hypothetical protein